jgi:hypothetical protein
MRRKSPCIVTPTPIGSYGVATPIDPEHAVFRIQSWRPARFIGRGLMAERTRSVSACSCSALHHEVTRNALRGCSGRFLAREDRSNSPRISHSGGYLANHLAASGFVLPHHITPDMPPPGDQSITRSEPPECGITG